MNSLKNMRNSFYNQPFGAWIDCLLKTDACVNGFLLRKIAAACSKLAVGMAGLIPGVTCVGRCE